MKHLQTMDGPMGIKATTSDPGGFATIQIEPIVKLEPQITCVRAPCEMPSSRSPTGLEPVYSAPPKMVVKPAVTTTDDRGNVAVIPATIEKKKTNWLPVAALIAGAMFFLG